VLRDQGKYEQAEETYRQALRLIETVLGKDVEKAAGKRSLNHAVPSIEILTCLQFTYSTFVSLKGKFLAYLCNMTSAAANVILWFRLSENAIFNRAEDCSKIATRPLPPRLTKPSQSRNIIFLCLADDASINENVGKNHPRGMSKAS